MASTAMVPRTYARLRERIRETLLFGRRRIEQEKVRTYWQTGWYINAHVRIQGSRAAYARQVLLKLSKDLGVHDSVLRRCSEFQEKFPIRATWHKLSGNPSETKKNGLSTPLTWSHYRLLLTLGDNRRRFQLLDQAARHGWTVEELERRIARSRAASLPKAGEGEKKPPELLTPQRGKFSHYRIVEDRGTLMVDYGFASYEDLDPEEAKGLAAGDIVYKVPGKAIEKRPEAKPRDLYTYPAQVLKWIDADTPWMKIYLYGKRSVKEKLRLRGIDAPERDTPQGQAAKKFVESETAKAESVLITTTKPDKYDRYLSDVFLVQQDGKEIFLNNLLLERGFARLKSSFSYGDWDWLE